MTFRDMIVSAIRFGAELRDEWHRRPMPTPKDLNEYFARNPLPQKIADATNPPTKKEPAMSAQALSMPELQAQQLAQLAPLAGGPKLDAFESFLKKVGKIGLVALNDIIKYAIPVANIVSMFSPGAGPIANAFTEAATLVQKTVLLAEQKWAQDAGQTGQRKLADVLSTVTQPVVALFAQAGVQVDAAYVTNLVNGIVSLLNVQPSTLLASVARK